jgi:hypothetical protein
MSSHAAMDKMGYGYLFAWTVAFENDLASGLFGDVH